MSVKNLLSEIGNKIQSLPVKSDDHCIKKMELCISKGQRIFGRKNGEEILNKYYLKGS